MGLRMTTNQQRTVFLLKKLGSNVEQGIQSGNSVRVPVPFHASPHNNVEVFVDGSWHDYSANKGWGERGLVPFGALKDLEEAIGEQFNRIWYGLSPISNPAVRGYCEKRMLDIPFLKEYAMLDGNPVICFPMNAMTASPSDIVGIQRRFIQEHDPKNLAFKGSDAKHGYFFHPSVGGTVNKTLYVCEGATDTYTEFLPSDGWAVGAISCSNLDGILDYLKTVDREIRIVLCFDADEPGQEAQNKVYVAIKDRFDTISTMVHSIDCKDLNDEWVRHGEINVEIIDGTTSDKLFVTMVDELPTFVGGHVNFVGFFPPDFPDDYHTAYPDPKATIYIFPESYGRSEVNNLMWKLRKSAYILRGW